MRSCNGDFSKAFRERVLWNVSSFSHFEKSERAVRIIGVEFLMGIRYYLRIMLTMFMPPSSIEAEALTYPPLKLPEKLNLGYVSLARRNHVSSYVLLFGYLRLQSIS